MEVEEMIGDLQRIIRQFEAALLVARQQRMISEELLLRAQAKEYLRSIRSGLGKLKDSLRECNVTRFDQDVDDILELLNDFERELMAFGD